MFCPGCGKPIPDVVAVSACPSCGAIVRPLEAAPPPGPGPEPDPAPPDAPAGIPWEDRAALGLLPALLANLRLCLFDPDTFYRSMPKRENLGAALGYLVLMGWIGMIGALLWGYLLRNSQEAILKSFGLPVASQELRPGFYAIIYAVIAILAPVFILLGAFIWSGILHASLWLVGGARHGFESTLRVYSYAAGSTTLFQWIPFCGGLINLVWSLVLQVYGLSRTHEISGGKAALAVLLPIGLCCLVVFAVAILFAGALAALVSGSGGSI